VTIVLTASSLPVGLIMNQNKTFVMLTIQMACGAVGVSEVRLGERGEGTNPVEVEAIAEHQLPKAHRLDFKRLDRTKKRETELRVDR
jgi:hypothetical protein